MGKFFSIGYQKSNSKILVNIFQTHLIDEIIDVRSFPFSKYNKDFDKLNLKQIIEANGMKYEWKGESLGGLKKCSYKEKVAVLNDLIERVRSGKRVCLFCMEKDPEECHRKKDLAQVIRKLYDEEVVHLDNTNGDVIRVSNTLGEFT